jgi:hypothetical protein
MHPIWQQGLPWGLHQSVHQINTDAAGDTSSFFQYPQRVLSNHIIDHDLPVQSSGFDAITRSAGILSGPTCSRVQRALKL